MTAPEASAGIDVVLAASAFETVRDRIPAAALLRMAGAIVRHPGPAGQEITALARRLASITNGSATPDIPADRRFADRAWQGNPLMRRLAMGYLVSCAAVEQIVTDTVDVAVLTKRAAAMMRSTLSGHDPERRTLGCLTNTCECEFARGYRQPVPAQVRYTSIYSRTDGVVRWQACVADCANCVEIPGSHLGMAFNRHAYGAIAQALA